MKKLFLIMSLALVLVVTGCGNNEVNGKGPEDIPVEWVNAKIQNDQAKMLHLLDQKTEALDPKTKSNSKDEIKHFRLTEWKANDERYFYEIEYKNPTNNEKVETEKMEVIKTKNGWKRTKYSNLQSFDKLVQDLKPEVLRELHDE
jgi:predicted small lipoprotein YifL